MADDPQDANVAPDPSQTNTDGGDGGGDGSQETSWLEGLPEELRGNEALTGFKSPGEMAKAFVDRPPADPVPKEGVPKDPKDYTFATPEGVPEMETLVDGLRKVAGEKGLSQEEVTAAYGVFSDFVSGAVGEMTTNQDSSIETLRKDWGDEYDANNEAAMTAVTTFGGEELFKFLDETIIPGKNIALRYFPPLVKAFASIGKSISEDTYIHGGPGPKELERTEGGRPILDFSKSMDNKT